jgi:hypothetical protein
MMTQVSVDKVLAEELVDLKLQQLAQEIANILLKWEYKTVDKFLKDAENGTLAEAEMDAISMTNLIDQREELFRLKLSWNAKK